MSDALTIHAHSLVSKHSNTSSRTHPLQPSQLEENVPNQASILRTRSPHSDLSVSCSALSKRAPLEEPASLPLSTLSASVSDHDANDRQTIMAVQIRSGRRSASNKVGIAYFSCDDQSIHVGDFDSFDVVNKVKQKIEPTVILTSAQPEDDLYTQLQLNELDLTNPFSVKTLKAALFHIDNTRAKLDMIEVGSDANKETDADTMSTDKYLSLRSRLDVDALQSFSALGALLSYLMQNAFLPLAPNSFHVQSSSTRSRMAYTGATFTVKAIVFISDLGYMHVDFATMRNLAIFATDPHPGLTHRSKEGHSVFSLLNYTKTAGGAKRLKKWLTHPLTDLTIINRRLARIEALMQPAAASLVQEVRTTGLHNVKELPALLKKFHESTPHLGDWRSLSNGLSKLLLVAQLILGTAPTEVASLFRSASDTRDLLKLNHDIDRIIDLKGELNVEGGIKSRQVPSIRTNIDQQLDALKEQYHNLPSFLSEVARNDLAAGLMPTNVPFALCFIAQLGFLVKISVEDESHMQDWKKQTFRRLFAAEDRVYYSSERCDELNQSFGDLSTLISDREAVLTRAMQQRVSACTKAIDRLSDVAFELDCLLSLAVAARSLELVRPHFHPDEPLRIIGGRHLVYEQILESFVPNDTIFSSYQSKAEPGGGEIHIITGPNSTGKSLLLKQVAIIVWLAHCGCYVPATSVQLPIHDALFSAFGQQDYTTNNSTALTNDLSTWCIEVTQVAYLARHATERSLCIIDEFGRSTNETDAAALTASLVQILTQRKEKCPRVMLATHAHKIFCHSLVTESVRRLKCFCMSFTLHSTVSTITKQSSEFERQDAAMTDSTIKTSSARSKENLILSLNCNDVETVRAQQDSKIIPFFQLTPGINHKSYALACAVSAGLAREIVERAAEQQTAFVRGNRLQPLAQSSFTDEWQKLLDFFQELVEIGLEQEVTDFELNRFMELLCDQVIISTSNDGASAQKQQHRSKENNQNRQSVNEATCANVNYSLTDSCQDHHRSRIVRIQKM